MQSALGLVCGLKSEAAALAPLCRHPDILTRISGASARRAYEQAHEMVTKGATALVSIGIAGALGPDLKNGDISLPEQVVTETESWCVDPAWRQQLASALPQACNGAVYGSDAMILTPDAKADLTRRTGAILVDMESHAVAQAAAEAGLPFLVLRTIADSASQTIPLSATLGVAPDGNTRPGAVIGALLFRPQDLPGLIRVGADSARATKILGRCAADVLPGLLSILGR